MSKKYSVKALHQETNETQTLTLTGNNPEEVREILLNSGFVEPFEIKAIRHTPATEAQLKYARDLGVKVPEGISKADISVLIDRVNDNDPSNPNPELIEFASGRGLKFSDYIGKKALYNHLWIFLQHEHKAAFFIFSIYRWLTDNRSANLDKHSHKQLFYEFALEKMKDERFVKSLANYQGEELRFFGTLQFSDGGDTRGGSVNTIAYKAAADFLKEKLGVTLIQKKRLPKSEKKHPSTRKKEQQKTEPLGKAGWGCILSMIVIFILLFWGFYHLVFNVWLKG